MDIFIINLNSANTIELEDLKKFKKKEISNEQKLKQHCFAYHMLNEILKEFYKIDNPEVVYDDKKPCLKNKQKHFSISHSEDYISIAFSDIECGIDIEKIKNRNYDEISHRMGFNQCNSLEDFYREWTKYEAEYKLGNKAQSIQTTKFEDYILAFASNNPQEEFKFYIQKLNTSSNANT